MSSLALPMQPSKSQQARQTASVRCPSCGSAYRLPTAVAGQGRLRCGQCQHVWTEGDATSRIRETPDTFAAQGEAASEPPAYESMADAAVETDLSAYTLMSAEDIEALLDTNASQRSRAENRMDSIAAEAPAAEDGGNAIDDAETPAAPPEPDLADSSPDDEAMTAEEIEALLTGDMADEPDPAGDGLQEPDLDATSPDDEAMSAEDIDALLSGEDTDPASDGDMSEMAADSAADEDVDTFGTAPASDDMTADEIEALLAEDEDGPASPNDADPSGLDSRNDGDAGVADTSGPIDEDVASEAIESGETDGAPSDGKVPAALPVLPIAPVLPSRRHHRYRPAIRAAAGIVLVAGFAASLVILAERTAVVTALPRMATLYEALGVPVNLSDFTLEGGAARIAVNAPEPHLAITVTVRNRSETPQPMPAIDLVLRDGAGAELLREPVPTPTDPLRGLDEASFKAQIVIGKDFDAGRVADAVLSLAPPQAQRAALARLMPIEMNR